MTLGVFALVVNGVLLAFTAVLTQSLHVGDFADAVLGALVISIITTLLEFVLRPLKSEQ